MRGMFYIQFSELWNLIPGEHTTKILSVNQATRELYSEFAAWWSTEYFRLKDKGLLEEEKKEVQNE